MPENKEDFIRKELEKQLAQFKTKTAESETSPEQSEVSKEGEGRVEENSAPPVSPDKAAENKMIEEFRDDEDFVKNYHEKVAKGVVAPPDNAPAEVKKEFASKAEETRRNRWEAHRQAQTQATNEWFDGQPAQIKQKLDAQKAKFSKKAEVTLQQEAGKLASPANVDAPKPQPGSGGPTAPTRTAPTTGTTTAPAAPATMTGGTTGGNAGRST